MTDTVDETLAMLRSALPDGLVKFIRGAHSTGAIHLTHLTDSMHLAHTGSSTRCTHNTDTMLLR